MKKWPFFVKKYPLSSDRLGVGDFFTVKWWDFTVYKKRYFLSILNEKRVLNIRIGSV